MSSVTAHIRSDIGWKGLPAPRSFRAWIELAMRGAKRRRDTEISVLIVDARAGRELNREYRGKDYATNVLSFPIELPPGIKSPMIGDHYAHMVIHGTLHLLGFDHIDDRDATTMEALETKLLASIGIADPYAPI